MTIDLTQVVIWLGGIAIVCLFFKDPITRLLPHLHWGKDGVGFNPPSRQSTNSVDAKAEAERLMKVFDNPLLLRQEDNIKRELSEKGLLDKPNDAMPVLIRHLAATQLANNFEVFFRIVFRSQINLLDFLNSKAMGIPIQSAEPFYQAAASQYPGAFENGNFRSWLSWPLSAGLIEESNSVLKITDVGRQFLLYLMNSGIDRNLKTL